MVERIKLELPVSIEKEGKLYVATCPVFHVASQGPTEKEALNNIAEALMLFIEDEDVQRQYRSEIEQHIVKPSDKVECVTIELNGWQAAPHIVGT